MAIILHPKQSVDIVLSDYREHTQPPVFEVKALSMPAQMEMRKRIESHEVNGLFSAEPPELAALLADYVTGWRNMGDWKFDPATLQDTLQRMMARRDGVELMWAILSMNTVSVEQKKTSV